MWERLFIAAIVAVGFVFTMPLPQAQAQQVRPATDDGSDGSSAPSESAQAADQQESSAIEWDWNLRVRPRMEIRTGHRFGLPAEALRYGPGTNNSDFLSQQSRLGVSARRGAVSAQVVAQHAARWGVFGGDELSMPPLGLYRASLVYDDGGLIRVEAGRFELAYGDERVLGSVGWSQVGRTWDGLRLGWRPTQDVQVDTFGARYDDADGGLLGGDSFLAGVYGMWEPATLDVIDAVDLYGLYDLRWGRTLGVDRRQIIMIGSRLAASVADFEATVEGGYQVGLRCPVADDVEGCAGERADIRAYFVDSEAAYGIGDLSPFVGYSQASGDDGDEDVDSGYTQLYPTGHKWLGYMDIIGPRTNLREIRAGLDFAVGHVSYRVAAHRFTRLEPATQLVGTELNLQGDIPVSDYFDVTLGYGQFFPGEGISADGRDPQGLAHWGFAQATGNF